MTNVECLECSGDVALPEDVMLAEIIPCPDCGVDLEVTNLEPVEFDLAPEIEEDWGE